MSLDRMALDRRDILTLAAVWVAALAAPAVGQEAEAPREPAAFYARLEARRGTGDGIFITRAELEMMDVRTVRSAISLRAREPFRTRGGEACRPAVYWDGLKLEERWDPNRSREARAPVRTLEGIEIYYADWMDLPLMLRGEECGGILLWTRPDLADADAGSTLLKAGLVLVLGVVFFLAVGS